MGWRGVSFILWLVFIKINTGCGKLSGFSPS